MAIVGGSSLTDSTTDTTVNVNGDSSYALAVDLGLDPQTQIQIFYRRQHSVLRSEPFAPSVNNVGLGLEYYHALEARISLSRWAWEPMW